MTDVICTRLRRPRWCDMDEHVAVRTAGEVALDVDSDGLAVLSGQQAVALARWIRGGDDEYGGAVAAAVTGTRRDTPGQALARWVERLGTASTAEVVDACMAAARELADRIDVDHCRDLCGVVGTLDLTRAELAHTNAVVEGLCDENANLLEAIHGDKHGLMSSRNRAIGRAQQAEAECDRLQAALTVISERGCAISDDRQCAGKWPSDKRKWCNPCFAAASIGALGDQGGAA